MKNLSNVNFKSSTKMLAPKTLAFLNSFLLSPFSFLALTISFLLSPSSSFSQAPEIEWQNSIGGNASDFLTDMAKTSDGGYILGGYSQSTATGDKTEPEFYDICCGYDFWVVKINSFGIVEWDKTIGGGADDYLMKIQQTSDGGYILGGPSCSGISGNKTEAHVGSESFEDFWIVKINSIGDIEWQNNIGGTGADYLYTLNQTSDGGYIVGGRSSSPISGEKTEAVIGSSDFWVIKLNASGNIEWQNTIGGSTGDYLRVAIQTADGGYIIGGESSSGISGDKTESSMGDYDYWVLKLNAAGSIEWQNTIGGNNLDKLYSIIICPDGGYLLGGNSLSGISGDKTEINLGDLDYWIVKIDETGIIEWQNTIGGSQKETLNNIEPTDDGGYLIGGSSWSSISGDKTEVAWDISSPYTPDFWYVKINSSGIMEWDKTFGGTSYDELFAVKQSQDGGYLLGGYSVGGISGDLTDASNGQEDYYLIKLQAECSPFATEICNSLDDNCNGLIDDEVVETVSISAVGPTIFCQGGSVLLTAIYSGTSVQWKKNGIDIPGAILPNYIATIKGYYTCETSSACGNSTSTGILVNVFKNPPASITAGGATTFCVGGSVILTANAGAGLSYQWYKGASLLVGATSINYTATIAGNYKCRVTKTATGCFKNSNTISVSVPCKESMETLNSEINIYPNPVADKITINIDHKFISGSISITDISGKTLIQQELQSGISEYEISSLTSGLYFINFNIDGITSTQKFIKQ